MPIYDYACTVCGRVVEVVHGVNGQGPQACETCGGAMKKLLSSPAVHFKGSGWAKKDRGASTSTKAAARSASGTEGSSQDGAAGTPPSDSAATESKNESKNESKMSEAPGASSSSGADPA